MKLLETKKGRPTMWVAPEGTHFIAVDLEVFSRRRLAGLVEALGEKVFVLYEGKYGSRYNASFELGDSWNLSADQEIRQLVKLVRGLPPQARNLWKTAQSRVFNIGVQAGFTPHAHELELERATVEAVADVQGRIAITTYAPDAPSRREKSSRERTTPVARK